MTSAVLDTASEFYSELKRKGLHFRKENGRDDELLKELARNIGCPDNNLQKYLKKSCISAETFLIAFLKVAQPFAKMFEDIWRYLSQKAAPHSSENISVRFGLPGSTESTTIDLETFRRYADSFRYVSSKIKFLIWPEAELSQLFTLSKILEYPGLDEHQYEYKRYTPGEVYSLPSIQDFSHAISSVIQDVRNLFQSIIDDFYLANVSRNDVGRNLQEFSGNQEQERTYEDLSGNAYLLTDLLPRWYLIFAHLSSIPHPQKEEAYSFYQKEIEPQIIQNEKGEKTLLREALDILDLPFWKHRWHTYEIWSTVITITSLADYQPIPRISNGRIAFDSYNAEIIATLKVKNHLTACVAIQIQTPFDGEPNRKSIKPDLRVCYSSNVDQINETVAIIEFKQRLAIDRKHIEEVSRAYTGGAPNSAGTIIINYDEPDLSPILAANSYFIQGVHPGNPNKIKEFKGKLIDMLRSFKFEPQMLSKVVLFDVSSSMGSKYETISVQAALSKLLDESSIRIFRFNDGLVRGGDLNASINFSISGGTQLGKALDQLLELVGEEIHQLLIVSDGEHEHPMFHNWNIRDVRECSPERLSEMLPWILG